MRAIRRRVVTWLGLGLAVGTVTFLGLNAWVYARGRSAVVEAQQARPCQVIMVLGAYVYPGGTPSSMLSERLRCGLKLYRAGVADRFLLSGDHGQADYDEVNSMRRWLEKEGVPSERIFLDHAGFDTYNSMVRARDVFQVKSMVVVSQGFHLPRALYLARCVGIVAQGVACEQAHYSELDWGQYRELGARLKAFFEVHTGTPPVFGGIPIPITGEGGATHDDR